MFWVTWPGRLFGFYVEVFGCFFMNWRFTVDMNDQRSGLWLLWPEVTYRCVCLWMFSNSDVRVHAWIVLMINMNSVYWWGCRCGEGSLPLFFDMYYTGRLRDVSFITFTWHITAHGFISVKVNNSYLCQWFCLLGDEGKTWS